MRWQDVPIPDLMRHLPRDKRGYPIPANVQIDPDGTPHFALNPEEIRQKLFKEDRCSICGGKLLRGRWMIGGPASAFHPDGAYQDPPVHHECGHYALQVCPYLAMPSYTKPVSTKTMANRDVPSVSIVIDPTLIKNRPDPFVMVMYVGQTFSYDFPGHVRTIRPKRPYRRCEFWSNGVQLSDREGVERIERYFIENKQLFSDPSRWEKPTPYMVSSPPKRKR